MPPEAQNVLTAVSNDFMGSGAVHQGLVTVSQAGMEPLTALGIGWTSELPK